MEVPARLQSMRGLETAGVGVWASTLSLGAVFRVDSQMQADSVIQAIAAGIVVVVNCLTVGVGIRTWRDIYRRLRALEARAIPPQVMYMPVRSEYYSPPPTAPYPVTYDPV